MKKVFNKAKIDDNQKNKNPSFVVHCFFFSTLQKPQEIDRSYYMGCQSDLYSQSSK